MYPVIREKRLKEGIKQNKKLVGNNKEEAEYLTFSNLEQTGIVKHLFTTRFGGVSEGIYSSMNLSFTRGDDKEKVMENYRRVSQLLGCRLDRIVCSDQTHTTNIRYITEEDAGKGVVYPRDYTNIDGMITNVQGIALATFYADCVPLYFVDPVHYAIGLAHSGWRGTVARMGEHMLQAMEKQFGSKPEEVFAAIGPSICQECYEVSEDVAKEFQQMFAKFSNTQKIIDYLNNSQKYHKEPAILKKGKAEGKYQLDLWLANAVILCQAGMKLEHIEITDICTCHNPAYLFSHRASEGKRGNLGAFLML